MKRDLYIDYAKGLATLSIVFIHTVFWSGQFYVSNEMRIFSLLFDVPIFFALSGLTSSGNIDKTFRRLLKLQITYMIFVTGLFFFDGFFKVFLQSFFDKETYQNFFLNFQSVIKDKNQSQRNERPNDIRDFRREFLLIKFVKNICSIAPKHSYKTKQHKTN